jgi:spore coat polysaccharide biosynthesis predicted glycosyltransferase SpsG
MFLSSLTKYTKKIKTKVILGPATIKSKKIKLFEKKYQKHIKIIQSTKDMHKEISRAEIGICSGGITTYEFAAMRVPFAIVSQVKHQLITAREWERKGHAINLGLISSKTSNRIDKFLKNIVEKRLPQINKSNIIDGLGAQRVAKEILGIKLDS